MVLLSLVVTPPQLEVHLHLLKIGTDQLEDLDSLIGGLFISLDDERATGRQRGHELTEHLSTLRRGIQVCDTVEEVQVDVGVAGSAIATILHHPTRIRIYSCTPS
jgi:hypothetical protein